MPLFSEYLAICKRYGCVPFIELKTMDGARVAEAVRAAGIADDEVVMSACGLERLRPVRDVSKEMYIHLIFAKEEEVDDLAALGNAGLAWNIPDSFACPPEKVAEMVKAHGLEKQCWFITREYDLIKRYKAALPEGQTLHWMNLGNWGYIDFDKPGECEKCEASMMALFENAAKENFKDIDNVQLHCQVRVVDGKYVFCPKPETMKACVARLHAAGVEASMCVWQKESDDPGVYKALFEMGFDSFGTDYPEALYQAVEEMKK